MGKMYLGKCKHGLVVYGAIANTAMEQAECSREIKSLTKKGFTVELVEVQKGDPMPEWCLQAKCKSCKLNK